MDFTETSDPNQPPAARRPTESGLHRISLHRGIAESAEEGCAPTAASAHWQTVVQLREYFAGERTEFGLPAPLSQHGSSRRPSSRRWSTSTTVRPYPRLSWRSKSVAPGVIAVGVVGRATRSPSCSALSSGHRFARTASWSSYRWRPARKAALLANEKNTARGQGSLF